MNTDFIPFYSGWSLKVKKKSLERHQVVLQLEFSRLFLSFFWGKTSTPTTTIAFPTVSEKQSSVTWCCGSRHFHLSLMSYKVNVNVLAEQYWQITSKRFRHPLSLCVICSGISLLWRVAAALFCPCWSVVIQKKMLKYESKNINTKKCFVNLFDMYNRHLAVWKANQVTYALYAFCLPLSRAYPSIKLGKKILSSLTLYFDVANV